MEIKQQDWITNGSKKKSKENLKNILRQVKMEITTYQNLWVIGKWIVINAYTKKKVSNKYPTIIAQGIRKRHIKAQS